MLTDTAWAIYYEHKERTGHDVYDWPGGQRPLSLIGCMVCIHLDNLKKEFEDAQHQAMLANHGLGDTDA